MPDRLALVGSAEAPLRAPERPLLVGLASAEALDVGLVGGKAAALARATAAGLPTLPGVVLTTAFCDLVDGGADLDQLDVVAEASRAVGGPGQPLVARSSSPVEDQGTSSMAGQFDSVIGIEGDAALRDGVRAVLASRQRTDMPTEPIAVLVQPLVEPSYAGVAFGLDPVSGRSDRRVVTAVVGSPGPLVSGEVEGARYLLDAEAHVVELQPGDGPYLPRQTLRRILDLGQSAAALFGAPQDIEWALDDHDRLWLLQSRPVTSEERGVPAGPLYGPGPVAETFPEPLSELECDLWIPPLRAAVTHVVRLTGSATERQLARSEIVIAPGGRVAIDLQLAGEVPPARGLAHRLNPMPEVRRLRSAWRVGRLRAALPQLAERLVDKVDGDLEAVPALETLTSRQLIALVHRGQHLLRSLHAHEILMGALSRMGCGRLTGASVALRVLAEARSDGLDDDTILQRSPVVLALTAPAVRSRTELPASATAPDVGQTCSPTSDDGVIREALRLRTRWVHEVTGRAAWVLGDRLARSGLLPAADAVRHLTLADLEAVVTKRSTPVRSMIAAHDHSVGEPLPACFQLSDRGRPIAVRRSTEVGGGTGAGGGAGAGPVTLDVADPPPGSVLVTTTLAPGLGPILPRLAGLVAETGSVLSHLAILAREMGVPIVVGYPGATSVYGEGDWIAVDGDTGDVSKGATP